MSLVGRDRGERARRSESITIGVLMMLRTLRSFVRGVWQQPLGAPFSRVADTRLGVLERWYAAQRSPRIVVAMVERDAPFERDAILRAIERVHTHHAAVLDRVPDPTCRSWRSASERAPVFFEREPMASERAIEHAIAEPIDRTSSTPRYRVRVAADQRRIIVAFDHVIADGTAAMIFAHDLAHALAGAPSLSAATEPATPLDARLDLRPRVRELAHAVRERDPNLTQFERGPALHYAPDALRTRVHELSIDPIAMQTLHAHTKARQLTVHPALLAAGVVASRAALRTEPARTARVLTPISVRSRCEPEPAGMGVFISSIETDVSGACQGFWEIASRCAQDLTAKRADAHRTLGLLAWVRDLDELVAERERAMSNLRNGTVEVSNLGRAKPLPEGVRVAVTQGNHYAGPVFCVTAASSHEGALRAFLSVPHPLIDDEVASTFVRAFREAITCA